MKCKAKTQKGTPCKNKAVEGTTRCAVHKGTKAKTKAKSKACKDVDVDGSACSVSRKSGCKPCSKPNRKKPGCSNAGKYKNWGLSPSDFCGPSGGACKGTYPVHDSDHAILAKVRSRHAPNPEGIKKCAMRKARANGWLAKDGKTIIRGLKKKGKR